MEIHFKPELEDKRDQHDEWFRRAVKKGLAQLDRGEFVEHDEVIARIDTILRTESTKNLTADDTDLTDFH